MAFELRLKSLQFYRMECDGDGRGAKNVACVRRKQDTSMRLESSASIAPCKIEFSSAAGAGRGLHCVRIYKVHGSKGGGAVRSRLDAGAASYVQALPPLRRAPAVTGSSGAW